MAGHLVRADPVAGHFARAGPLLVYFARAGFVLGHFSLGHFARAGPVAAFARAGPVAGHFVRPALGHLVQAVRAEPAAVHLPLVQAVRAGPAAVHLPRPPKPGTDLTRRRLVADGFQSDLDRRF